MKIQAIETSYKNYKFRSRLEAKCELGSSEEYARIHYAARKRIDQVCSKCGSTDHVQAALKHDVTDVLIDPKTGCPYSNNVNDYFPLCVKCHRKLDMVDERVFCNNGHALNDENVSIKPDGSRRCKACHRNDEAKRRKSPCFKANQSVYDKEYRAKNPMTQDQKERKLELQRLRRSKSEHGRSGN